MNISPSNRFRIPTWVLVAIDGISIALVAIFIFKVNPGLVLSYGLVAAMVLSHFFMHSGHGNHNDHQEHDNQSSLHIPPVEFNPVPVENDDTNKHSHGCCH